MVLMAIKWSVVSCCNCVFVKHIILQSWKLSWFFRESVYFRHLKQEKTLCFESFSGWHTERTIPEDWRHKTKHSHRGPLWELSRYAIDGCNLTFGSACEPWYCEYWLWCNLIFQIKWSKCRPTTQFVRIYPHERWERSCWFCVIQRRWPPTCDMWGGWTSLKSQTMNIWGLCSRNCSREKDTPLTTPTTGLAGRLWVTDHILHVSNFTYLTSELNSLLSPQPTPVGSVHIDSGASAVTRESHPHRDRPSQHPPIRNQVRPVEQWGPDCFLPCCGLVDGPMVH